MQIKRFLFLLLVAQSVLSFNHAFSLPDNSARELADDNTKIDFEVHAPWNILDGKAEKISGNLTFAEKKESDLQVNLSVQKINYKAGLSIAGRLVSVWLRANSPTPAKFMIAKSSLNCILQKQVVKENCGGKVDGKLTIWGKDYTIDIPVEIKDGDRGKVLQGFKEIKFGEYGFGDPESTIAHLDPVIKLNFSIALL